MPALRPAGPVPPPAAPTFASLTGTQRMGKHLQFGKGKGFFPRADGWPGHPLGDKAVPHTPSFLSFCPAVFVQDSCHVQRSRKYPASQQIISPQHWEERQAGSLFNKLVPSTEMMLAIIFFTISVIIWAAGISLPLRHRLRCCRLGRMRRMLRSCVKEDVELSVLFNEGSHGEMIPSSQGEQAARCSCNAGQRLLGFYQRA